MSEKNKIHTLYLWLDLEMTGLDVEKERIIEIAAIITDTKLKELSTFHKVVYQPQELLAQMDEWNQKQHKSTGLMDQVPKGETETQVEQALINWCTPFFKEERIILAGNTIGQDRLFLTKHFKEFSKLLHYRQLDVTSLKLPFLVEGVQYEKKNTHRALDDIKESIAEFKFLWGNLNR